MEVPLFFKKRRFLAAAARADALTSVLPKKFQLPRFQMSRLVYGVNWKDKLKNEYWVLEYFIRFRKIPGNLCQISQNVATKSANIRLVLHFLKTFAKFR